ncbi:other/IKS protein kinase [Ephemerocybe angulata]|uniref:non-specific serine/threonine protein kinase n=1 Tax=Ephemerocybe angulata TaxID=980116 RepID=A0A8H6I074_9AGAR|nr:other/IKS protein kinase [Tulosesus angulatus]
MSSVPSSPSRTAVTLASTSDAEWQPILHASNQVVLYNPRSHALTISTSTNYDPQSSVVAKRVHKLCPYCKQTLPPSLERELLDDELEHNDDDPFEAISSDPAYHSRATNYFQILAVSNDVTSRPGSPSSVLYESEESPSVERPSSFPAENMAEGYFNRFFQEEYKLGMGANGSVFLCQHVLDGNALGHFAVKKIAVGESHSYLLKILREVRLLEQLHHPNIVTYHHAWLETTQFSSFGPRVPTLHVLMQWAEGGSLDDFIDTRLGRRTAHPHIHPLPFDSLGPDQVAEEEGAQTPTRDSMTSRSARIRAFRAFQRANPEERERMTKEGFGRPELERKKSVKEWTPVHLLSAEEVKSLFQDVVRGLNFLHNKSILHLDLKPGNILLTWDDGRLIPRAMLTDFGTSRDMINSGRIQRSGNTGTLEYASPESLPSPDTGLLGQVDSKSDMWSLGMVLHKMLFFKLPYRYAAEGDANGEPISIERGQEGEKMAHLESEVLQYPGFKANSGLVTTFESRRLSRAYLVLLEGLLHKSPTSRPSSERVATAIREGKLDPLRTPPGSAQRSKDGSPDALIPVTRPASHSTPELQNLSRDSNNSSGSDGAPMRLSLPPSAKGAEKPTGTPSWVSRQKKAVQKSKAWKRVGAFLKSRNGRFSLKAVRSLVLVSKVLSAPRLCPNVEEYPRPVALAVLLGAAIADTVIEVEPWHRGLLFSLGLAAFHFNVLRYGMGSSLCCSR